MVGGIPEPGLPGETKGGTADRASDSGSPGTDRSLDVDPGILLLDLDPGGVKGSVPEEALNLDGLPPADVPRTEDGLTFLARCRCLSLRR